MNIKSFARTAFAGTATIIGLAVGLGVAPPSAQAQYSTYDRMAAIQQRNAAARQAQAIDQALRSQEIQVGIDPRMTAGLTFQQRVALIVGRKRELASQAQLNLSQVCGMMAVEVNHRGSYERYGGGRGLVTLARDINTCRRAGYPVPSGSGGGNGAPKASNGFPNEAMQKDLNTYLQNGANTSYSDYSGKNKGPGTGAR